jgi:hypothetical protein
MPSGCAVNVQDRRAVFRVQALLKGSSYCRDPPPDIWVREDLCRGLSTGEPCDHRLETGPTAQQQGEGLGLRGTSSGFLNSAGDPTPFESRAFDGRSQQPVGDGRHQTSGCQLLAQSIEPLTERFTRICCDSFRNGLDHRMTLTAQSFRTNRISQLPPDMVREIAPLKSTCRRIGGEPAATLPRQNACSLTSLVGAQGLSQPQGYRRDDVRLDCGCKIVCGNSGPPGRARSLEKSVQIVHAAPPSPGGSVVNRIPATHSSASALTNQRPFTLTAGMVRRRMAR